MNFTIQNYINQVYHKYNNNQKKEQMKLQWMLNNQNKSRKKSNRTFQLLKIK